jgi:hypothetical protein
MMVHIGVSPEMVDKAAGMARELGAVNHSILAGRGNMAGFLGELVACQYLNCTAQNTYQHDIVVNGRRYDVKAKQRKSLPKPDYMASVTDYQDQMAYGYIFVSVMLDNGTPTVVTLCGHMPRREFKDQATLVKAGEHDPSNNWTCSMDCWSLPYSQLLPIESLLSETNEADRNQVDCGGAVTPVLPAGVQPEAPDLLRPGKPVLEKAQPACCQGQCGSECIEALGRCQ